MMIKHTQMNDAHETHSISQRRERSPWVLWPVWIGWLFFIIPPTVSLIESHPPLLRLITTLFLVALFVCLYLWASWHSAREFVAIEPPPKQTEIILWLPIVALTVLCISIVLMNGKDWYTLFYFVSGYAGGHLRPRKAILMVFALMAISAVIGLLIHASWSEVLNVALFIVIISVLITGIVRSVTTSWELHAAREEIAHLAVTAERLRIARDLHDLLGHNLSLIALKSELAGRLLTISPERTANEIKDIEQVARSTLQEVREAVATYRQPSLASELHAAQQILAAAGIIYIYDGDEHALTSLPPTVEAILAWSVREGVTNVVKHSRAYQCLIRLTREQETVCVEVIDDGTAIVDHTANQGNGLRGLNERVITLDGQFESAHRSDGGFRLVVSLPLAQKEQKALV
jgi:two-component system sensor histidine kinase DesK